MIRYAIIGLLSLLPGNNFSAEDQSFALSKSSASIQINGTSNLHDWTMNLKTFDCYADFVFRESQINAIDKVAFSCKVTDLKSDNSMMDNKAYAALKSRVYPEIKFRMTSPVKLSPIDNNFSGNLGGDLVIAGKSVAVLIPLNGTLYNKNGALIIDVRGETELKMSDFEITPPTFLMGALKTGDKVTISFSLQFLQGPCQ